MILQATATADPPWIYLIRHGETEWSLSGRHTGLTDLPLTVNGENQARQLGEHINGLAFTHVFTSPLQRARQTCALAGLMRAAEIDADLIEWDYGEYEGRRSREIHEERPDWSIYRDGCPRGEMPARILTRTDRLIARLRLLNGNIALFSHGQIGSALVARWIGLPLVEAEHFILGTASLTVLGYHPHHPDLAVIDTLNGLSIRGV